MTLWIVPIVIWSGFIGMVLFVAIYAGVKKRRKQMNKLSEDIEGLQETIRSLQSEICHLKGMLMGISGKGFRI